MLPFRLSFGMTDPFPLAARGVYCQPYRVNGRREFYAVASNGDLVAVRIARDGQNAAPIIADLWDELNEADPISSHLSPPSLRLLR